MRSSDFISCFFEGFHSLFRSRGICLLKRQGDIFRFVPHHEVERGLFCSGVDLLVMTELHEGVELSPRFGVVGAEDSEIDLQFLVHPLCLSIGLGVVCCASERSNSKESGYFSEDL